MTPASFLRIVFVLSITLAGMTSPCAAQTAMRNFKENIAEGNPAAPVQIVMFYNPLNEDTYHHWLTVRPPLLANYITKNLVRIEYREIFRGTNDYATVIFLRCVPQASYATVVSAVLQDQEELRKANGTIASKLTAIARQAGLDMQSVGRCMAQPELADYVKEQREEDLRYYDIHHTPNYILSGQTYRFSAYATYANIDAALKLIFQSR